MTAAGFKNRRAGVVSSLGGIAFGGLLAIMQGLINGAGIIARILFGKDDHRAVAEPVGILVN
jgi:tetrahydromethanopterin S-methyltransferase subunit C